MTRRTTIRTLARVSAVVALSLAIAVVYPGARTARAGTTGSELVGFPSDPETADDPVDETSTEAPACRPAPPEVVHTLMRLSTTTHTTTTHTSSTPKPAPAARPAPVVRVVTPAPEAPEAPETPSARSRGRRSDAHTDTTFVVRAGSHLALNNFGGSVDLRTWAKNAIHVRADHSRRNWIEVEQEGPEVRVTSSSRYGPSGAVEYEITVPAWMAVGLSGVYNDVSADGLQGGLNVETVRGDIVVRRVAGIIELRSVEGLIDLVGAKGKITVSSVNEAVRIANASGDVAAEAVNGDIHMFDIDSKSVEATTVNGAVIYDGRILDGGDYRFATHNGDIALGLSDHASANVTVSTFSGEFESVFPVSLYGTKRGKRFSFLLGSGKAQIDLESFQGGIQVLHAGSRELRNMINAAWLEKENEFGKEFGKEWKWELKGKNAQSGDEEDNSDDEDQ